MATPPYQSASQSNVAQSGGLLRRIGSYFSGGGTPSYSGNGQPSPQGGGLFRSSPSYAPGPVAPTPPAESRTCPCMCAAEPELMECPIDPEALAAGQIAIVIPRQGA
jgi:hypothetical protein